jgi:hypothetical protein
MVTSTDRDAAEEKIRPDAGPGRSARPRGETFVWVTGMGLTIGLTMIVFLLGLVVYQRCRGVLAAACGAGRVPRGQKHSIPRRNPSTGDRDHRATTRRTRPDPRTTGQSLSADRREKQLFLGNRDACTGNPLPFSVRGIFNRSRIPNTSSGPSGWNGATPCSSPFGWKGRWQRDRGR